MTENNLTNNQPIVSEFKGALDGTVSNGQNLDSSVVSGMFKKEGKLDKTVIESFKGTQNAGVVNDNSMIKSTSVLPNLQAVKQMAGLSEKN